MSNCPFLVIHHLYSFVFLYYFQVYFLSFLSMGLYLHYIFQAAVSKAITTLFFYPCLISSSSFHLFLSTHTHAHTCTQTIHHPAGPSLIISAAQGQGDAAGKLKCARSASFDLSVTLFQLRKTRQAEV